MITMSSLRDLHKGRPAAVLGGGPSLPEDMKSIPDGAVMIAVNYHAILLDNCQFMVFNDDPRRDAEMWSAVESFRGTSQFGGPLLVSQGEYSEVQFDVPVWTGFYSSNTATWLALWMGCDPVILCGMDCYQGERKHFHADTRDEPCWHYPLEDHIRPWIEEGRHLLPNVERVRVMSGPLGRVFPLYEKEGAR